MADINQAWKDTCRVLLKDEIGDLERYRGYLLRHIEPVALKKSALSGKSVAVPFSENFGKQAKFISNEEAADYGKWLKEKVSLSINEIKDLDSVMAALAEKVCYCGNTVLGVSSGIEESTDCENSHFVRSSWMVKDSKYVAFSSKIRGSEYAFGCCDGGASNFNIKAYGLYMNTRCMEALRSKPVSDCYYVANLQDCENCMFSFNLRSKRHTIGNLQLGKDEYSLLKDKLLEDIRETLKQKKSIQSIIDIIGAARAPGKPALSGTAANGNIAAAPGESNPAEEAFQKTCQILLVKRLPPLKACEKWLNQYSAGIMRTKSCTSGKAVCAPNLAFYQPIKGRLVTLEESMELGKMALQKSGLGSLCLANAAEKLSPISATTPEVTMGSNLNLLDCVDYQDSANSYGSSFVFFSKGVGCSFFARSSESIFGSYAIFYSSFCIRCRNSSSLTRCFEVGDSYSCADCYFCHNCENVQNSMFCFNAKNLRYAVGNVEIGRERYLQLKAKVVEEIARRIEKDHSLKISVYNVGCKVQK